MTLVDVFLYPFVGLLVLCAVYRVLGWFMEDEPQPCFCDECRQRRMAAFMLGAEGDE